MKCLFVVAFRTSAISEHFTDFKHGTDVTVIGCRQVPFESLIHVFDDTFTFFMVNSQKILGRRQILSGGRFEEPDCFPLILRFTAFSIQIAEPQTELAISVFFPCRFFIHRAGRLFVFFKTFTVFHHISQIILASCISRLCSLAIPEDGFFEILPDDFPVIINSAQFVECGRQIPGGCFLQIIQTQRYVLARRRAGDIKHTQLVQCFRFVVFRGTPVPFNSFARVFGSPFAIFVTQG